MKLGYRYPIVPIEDLGVGTNSSSTSSEFPAFHKLSMLHPATTPHSIWSVHDEVLIAKVSAWALSNGCVTSRKSLPSRTACLPFRLCETLYFMRLKLRRDDAASRTIVAIRPPNVSVGRGVIVIRAASLRMIV